MKRQIISLILVLMAIYANARQITIDEAAAIASEFLNSSNRNVSTANHSDVTHVKSQSAVTDKAAPYYVFNADNNAGFVIISGDDRAHRILGYSDTGTFDFSNLPPQLAALLDQYAEQMDKLPANQPVDPSWNVAARNASTDGVLLKTANWGQDYPYNLKTPVIDGEHCPTGCIATAMAIIMKFHNWPLAGRHGLSYIRGGISHDVDFSKSKYNFSGFKNDYDTDEPQSEDIDNLAKLMYDCGAAAGMKYTVTASSTRSDMLGYVFMRYFKYSPECQFLERRCFPDEDWFKLIINNISDGQPVLYRASTEDEGHAFVIDGFKDQLFHINWGWNGLLNGYYSLDALNPNPYNFSYSHGMVINIIPDVTESEYAEIWSNIGLFKELTMAPVPGEDEGRGMEIECESITPGIPFSVITEYLSGPSNFVGEVALAVVNKNNEIIDILSKSHLEEERIPFGELFPYRNCVDAHKWPDIVYNGEIKDDYRLQLFAKRDDESDWLLVT